MRLSVLATLAAGLVAGCAGGSPTVIDEAPEAPVQVICVQVFQQRLDATLKPGAYRYDTNWPVQGSSGGGEMARAAWSASVANLLHVTANVTWETGSLRQNEIRVEFWSPAAGGPYPGAEGHQPLVLDLPLEGKAMDDDLEFLVAPPHNRTLPAHVAMAYHEQAVWIDVRETYLCPP